MAAAYHISADDGLITVQVNTQVDLIELYEVANSLLNDPQYDPTLPLLLDLRGMQLDMAKAALTPFNEFIIESYGRNRDASIAVVIDEDLEAKECADIYWLACAVGSAELFEDYDQALKWLIRREFADPVSATTA